MKNEIFIRLSIFDANNDNVTSLLNMQPTKNVQKGDLITKKGTRVYKYNIWSYEIILNNLEHIEVAFEKIIELFKHKKNELISLGKEYDLEISVSGYLKDGMPSIHFTHDSIDFIHAINAEVDIDIYAQ
ncbi:DUF4279 domain-containing protein [Sulfurimonas sp.]|uniref:DUF4279 domain-containing protein n=1 Tax=Sulfurimonas sp. TaxID=2022749 RepID=UPI003D0F48A8